MFGAKVALQMCSIFISIAKLFIDIDKESQAVVGSGLVVAMKGEIRLVCTLPDDSRVVRYFLLDKLFHGGFQWKEFA